MNKKTISLFLFTTILLALIGTGTLTAGAESTGYISFSSGITIFSPTNRTYNSQHLPLNLTLYSAGSMGYIDSRISMNFSIDEQPIGQVPLTVSNPGVHVVTNAEAFLKLPELTEGEHQLTLYLLGHNQKYHEPRFLSYVDTVYFSIDLTPPSIIVLSPENKTYTVSNNSSASIPLEFTVSENTSVVSYSLDDCERKTISENTSLTELTTGQHNLTMHAWDFAGNTTVSEKITFTIAEEQQPELKKQTEPFPTPLIAAASATAIGIGAGALVYNNYHKRKE